MSLVKLQSRPKVVGTLEPDHVSPIPPNQCWKISRFFAQKEKKSSNYQHCKWGRGELARCPNLFVRDCRFSSRSQTEGGVQNAVLIPVRMLSLGRPTGSFSRTFNPFTHKSDFVDFTLSNARQFYSSKGDPLGVKGLNNYLP